MKIINFFSPNYDKKKRTLNSVKMIVFHYTGMQSERESIKRLSNPSSKVSSHYLINRNGKIFRLVREYKLNLEHLFITHTHGDHIAALSDVRKRYPEINLHSGSEHAPSEQRVAPGNLESLGSIRIGCRLTPGHAADGITYIIDCWPNDAPMVAVVGDAIFAGSMGKDYSTPIAAQKNIREEILSLPPVLQALLC